MSRNYERIEHTADLALRVRGPSFSSLLINAAAGLLSLYTDPRKVRRRQTYIVAAEAPEHDLLLIRLLNELIFLFDTREFLCARIRLLRLDNLSLEAEASGETYDPARHEIRHLVKAATYHQFAIRPAGRGLETELVLDA